MENKKFLCKSFTVKLFNIKGICFLFVLPLLSWGNTLEDVFVKDLITEAGKLNQEFYAARLSYIHDCQKYFFFQEKSTLTKGMKDELSEMKLQCKNSKKKYILIDNKWKTRVKARVKTIIEAEFYKALNDINSNPQNQPIL